METKICDHCGAEYSIMKIHLGVRDKDCEKCKYCNTTLISWNGSNIFSLTEIHGPTKKYTVKQKNIDTAAK